MNSFRDYFKKLTRNQGWVVVGIYKTPRSAQTTVYVFSKRYNKEGYRFSSVGRHVYVAKKQPHARG